MSEDDLVAAIAERVRDVAPARLLVGIGDDAAAWQPSRSNRSVITTDALIEGVHFRRDAMSAAQVGHRALASNLSDIAAMGARPVLATVALGFPPGTDTGWLLACYDGIAALARRARCAIAGGDLTRAPAITFAITVVGEVRASNLKRRDAARPGDVVALTGPLGAAAAGLYLAAGGVADAVPPSDEQAALAAFRTPEPRLREAKFLAASRHVRAMMDTSDGLSTDLGRLCAASRVGAVLDDVPVHPAARAVAHDAERAAQWALDGGEDFELLLTVERRAFAHLASRFAAHTGRPLLAAGRIVADPGVRLASGPAVVPAGWDHLRTGGAEEETGAVSVSPSAS